MSLYIYADDVCVFQDNYIGKGDEMRTFSIDITGTSRIKVMVVTNEEVRRSTFDTDSNPCIEIRDAYVRQCS